MVLKRIGAVGMAGECFTVELDREYRDGLAGIDGFSMLKIIWWADRAEDAGYTGGVVIEKPYVKGPDRVGVFATRSQVRPNPVCISTVSVKSIDPEKGIIYTCYIDAFPGSPVIDIKPYLPSVDVSHNAGVPAWCAHWPESIEASAYFDWEAEFNFPS